MTDRALTAGPERFQTPVVRWLKRLRVSQPFNVLATTAARACLRVVPGPREFVIRHLHRVGGVKCPLPNGRVLRMWSEGDDWISNQLYWRGWNGYEPEMAPLLLQIAAEGGIVVDVGAYVGYFSILAALANPGGRVLAFEPMPRIFARLQRNVEGNRLSNITCVNAAVGARHGSAEMHHVDTALPLSSSLSSEFMHTWANREVHSTRVDVVTIDGFLAARGVTGVRLVKMDTEGTEPDVLSGMTATLARDRPAIFCEVLPGAGTAAALNEHLRPLGYFYYLLTPRGPIRRDAIVGDEENRNHLFTTSPLKSDGGR
jgi:FkbM family methyltransferase